MNQASRLNTEIRFVRDFIHDLELDPPLNLETLAWMQWMLKGLELQVTQLELLGFDHGKGHSFHAQSICQN